MKRIGILIALVLNISCMYAQYDKEKLSKILTANAWSVSAVNMERPERKITFNKDQSVLIEKDNGKGTTSPVKDKWSITSPDNIRWFLSMGSQTYELIVSYTKSGSQYIKLTHQAGTDKITGYYEMNLNAVK